MSPSFKYWDMFLYEDEIMSQNARAELDG